jgi:hypothetical protein
MFASPNTLRLAALQPPLAKRLDLLIEQADDPRHLALAGALAEALDELDPPD